VVLVQLVQPALCVNIYKMWVEPEWAG